MCALSSPDIAIHLPGRDDPPLMHRDRNPSWEADSAVNPRPGSLRNTSFLMRLWRSSPPSAAPDRARGRRPLPLEE